MRHIILSPVTCLAAPYFFTLSQKWHSFLIQVVEHKLCVPIFFGSVSCLSIKMFNDYIYIYIYIDGWMDGWIDGWMAG